MDGDFVALRSRQNRDEAGNDRKRACFLVRPSASLGTVDLNRANKKVSAMTLTTLTPSYR